MSDIESTGAELNAVKAKYIQAGEAAVAAEHHAESLMLRLDAVAGMIGSVLALNPAVQETDSSLVDDFVGSVGNVRSKVAEAHTSLSRVAQGADVDSPLSDAMFASKAASGISSFGREEDNGGVAIEADIARRISEAFVGLKEVHEALSRARNDVSVVDMNSNPAILIEEVVANIEAYQQRF